MDSTVMEHGSLTFPDDQAVWVLQAVAQLKAQDAKLAQAAVGDSELPRSLSLEDVGKGGVLVPILLVMHHCMPVTECPPLHVLA